MVGFAWGRQGIAARELSYVILLEATDSELLAEALCRDFTWEVVGAFPAYAFRLSQAEVEEWIARRPASIEPAASESLERLSPPPGSASRAPAEGSYVEDRVLLGRSPLSDVRVPDPTVSRLHAAAHRTGEGWVVYDLGSKNGIAVNGRRVQRATVRSGDLITLGDVSFRWCPESHPPEAA